MTRFVVVGAGQAAAAAARTLRQRGFGGEVVLVGDEPHLPYQRPPLSKEYLQGEAGRDTLFLLDEEWCAEHAVELRLGTRAAGIDPDERAVVLADGNRLTADAVLLATGGQPRRLPGAAGADGERVLTLRTIEDADAIRAYLGSGRHLIGVGAGFIGSEVAASARAAGTAVTVIEQLEVPLAGVLGHDMGGLLAAVHREHGVTLRTGETVESVEPTAAGVLVRTSAGAAVEGDAVVVGIGIVPSTEVAEAAGIATGDGVLVDQHCRTSVDGIYAAGDLANHEHPLYGRRLRVEHFDNANRQAAAAARNMLGEAVVYDDPHWFWSDQHGLNLQYAGHAERWDEVVVRGSVDDRDLIAFYLVGGVVRAAFAVERGRDMLVAKRLIAAGARPDPALLGDDSTDLRDLLAAG